MNKRLLKSVFVCTLAVAALPGCTSLKLIERTDMTALPPAVEVGDRIRVLDSAGESTEFAVTVIGGDFVEGEAKDDRVVRFAFTDLQEVRERRPAWGKTAALGAGVGYLVGIIAIGTMVIL